MDQTTVYYSFCSLKGKAPKAYKKYQREIADKILTYGIQKQFGIPFSRDQVKLGAHGKPYWIGTRQVHFNISNTAGMVVCAVSGQEVGVDAERVRRVGAPVVKRSCQEDEIAYITGITGHRQEHFLETEIEQGRFFQLWTLKESYLKMIGEGFHFPIEKAVFSIAEEDGAVLCSQSGFFQQKYIKEYWISICTRKESKIVWQEYLLEEAPGI